MHRIIDLIIRRYKYVLIALLLISIPFGFFFLKQDFKDTIDIYFDKDDPELKYFRQFQDMYGNEERAIIAFKDKDIFTNENFELIRKISAKLKEYEEAQRVFSLTNAEEAVDKDESIVFEKIIPDGKLSLQTLASLKKKVLDNKLLVKSLISEDGTTTSISMEIDPIDDYNKKRELILNLKDCVKSIAGNRVELRFSGSFVDIDFNDLIQRDFRLFTPIILAIIFCISLFMLRKLILAVFCMVTLALINLWSIGFFTLCNETLNMVTMLMAPVLLCISIAVAIHLLAHYRKEYAENGMDHVTAISNAIKLVWRPCLFTSLTTGIGFLSFITASIRPVKVLGVFTSIGVIFTFVITMTFLPAILVLFKKRFVNINVNDEKEDGVLTKILLKIGNFTTSSYKVISIVFIIIILIAVFGVGRITYETKLSTYLHDDNQIRLDMEFIRNNLGGTLPLILLFQAKSGDYDFTHPASLRLLEEIQGGLVAKFNHITSSFSIVDYYKEINEAFNNGDKKYYKIPDKQIDVIDYYELGNESTLDRIVAVDHMEARVSLQTCWESHESAKKAMKEVADYIDSRIGEHHTYRPTGLNPLILKMGANLRESLIKSFLAAFIVIFFMMFFVCRDIKLTIISMIPNISPIFLILGLMGWLGIPLDVATIMIASVTIGIAVDDTVHYIVWFKRNIESGMNVEASLIKAYRDTGKPIVITTVVLFIGFFILILGSVKPTQAFGVLTAIAMFFALVGDLFILPAIIMIFKPRLKK